MRTLIMVDTWRVMISSFSAINSSMTYLAASSWLTDLDANTLLDCFEGNEDEGQDSTMVSGYVHYLLLSPGPFRDDRSGGARE